MEYLAFMAAIPHSERTYLLDTLKEYAIGTYLMSRETATDSHKETKGEHFHFLVQMTEKDYTRYSKRVFIDKYKLRGKALKDKPRQYGKVKKILDFNRMAAYTIKDNNLDTDMLAEDLIKFQSISFQVKEKLEFKDRLMDHLKGVLVQSPSYVGDVHPFDHVPSFQEIALAIIDYYRIDLAKDKHALSKTQIDSYIRHYQMYYLPKEHLTTYEIYIRMFPYN